MAKIIGKVSIINSDKSGTYYVVIVDSKLSIPFKIGDTVEIGG